MNIVIVIICTGLIIWKVSKDILASTETPTTQKTGEEFNPVYENTEYGFKLEFPETWKNYKVISYTSIGSKIETATEAFYILLPSKDESVQLPSMPNYGQMFSLIFYNINQWQKETNSNIWKQKYGAGSCSQDQPDLCGEIKSDHYLNHNEKYLIAYAKGGEYGNIPSDQKDKESDIVKIAQSFKLIAREGLNDWNTYQNSKSHYSFKYPIDMHILNSQKDKILVTNKLDEEVQDSICQNFIVVTTDKNLTDYLKSIENTAVSSYQITSQTDYKIAGQDAIKAQITDYGCIVEAIFVKYKNKNIIIFYDSSNKIDNKIISSFQFD